MSDPAILAATITAWATVLAALIKVGYDARAIKHQVKNSHTTDLRQDIDNITSEVRDMRSEVRNARAELRAADYDSQKEHQSLWRAIREK